MKFNYIIYLTLVVLFNGCNSTKHVPEPNENVVVEIQEDEAENSSEFVKAASLKIDAIVAAKKHTPFNKLKEDRDENFEANSGVEIAHTTSEKKTGHQMYYHLQKSTLYIGSSDLCEQCPNSQ